MTTNKEKYKSAFSVLHTSGEFLADRTYVVTAIERKDGQDIGFDNSFFVSPLIDGYSPTEVNIATLYGGFTSFIPEDNSKVMYHIADMENIEPFADHKIHLVVQEGGFFDNANNGELAYDYDEATGTYVRNADFDGVNAFFDLPVDVSKADAGRAAEILAQVDEDVNDMTVATWADELTPDNLTDSYSLVGDSEDDPDAVIYVDVFTLNDDGTVTFELWEKK